MWYWYDYKLSTCANFNLVVLGFPSDYFNILFWIDLLNDDFNVNGVLLKYFIYSIQNDDNFLLFINYNIIFLYINN